VLQEGEFEPVGGASTQKVDVRVIAATNRDLNAEIASGRFREDLYFRLNVFPLELPALRHRGDDINSLADFFRAKAARQMGRSIDRLSLSDKQRLKGYNWPGNVRELQNVIERAVITAEGTRLNLDRALPESAGKEDSAPPTETGHEFTSILTAAPAAGTGAPEPAQRAELKGWRVSGKSGAANLLGIPPSTLNSRLKSTGLKRPGSS
jgi:transcriptional regulator with GAF, ATPase, and Fis domain